MKKLDYTHLLVCRSSFCSKCWQRGKPNKFDRFVVFGTDHQEFKVKVAHQDGLKGFTPHLYTIQMPYILNEKGNIYVLKICLMDSCGIEIRHQKGGFDVRFLETSEHFITEKSVDALVSLWRNTGYEIL